MKGFFKKLDKETLYGGIFGVIAIVAIVFEMATNKFDASSIAGGIKDMAGTILDVVILIVAFTAIKPKKKSNGDFKGNFENSMEEIVEKYSPLIEKDLTVSGRYNIADDMSVMSDNISCKYHRLFDFDYNKGEVSFIVSKTLFVGKSKDKNFDEQESIIKSITNKIIADYSDIVNNKYKPMVDGFKLTFNRELLTKEDADRVAQVIDKIILLYIVENKKS